MSTELKDQIKQELVKQKEEKLKTEKELNSKLKEITLYTRPNNPVCENFKKFYTDNGIKFKEKDLNLYPGILSTVQLNNVPVIVINDNYLVMGRDFNQPNQSVNILRHIASPDYVNPPLNLRIYESLKNLNLSLNKNISNLGRNLKPIVDVMTNITKELQEENKTPNEEKSK